MKGHSKAFVQGILNTVCVLQIYANLSVFSHLALLVSKPSS
jgi:hypothetical protein